MKNKSKKYIIGRLVAWIFLVPAFVLSGCQRGDVEHVQVLKPVFFPPAPDIPRLQFLKSYSAPEHLEVVKDKSGGWLEEFLLGEEEAAPERIVRPYGMAFSEGKLYVVDLGKKLVVILDFKNKKFGYLTKDRRLRNPVDIFIDGENKYVSDSESGAVFVFDKNDKLTAILGKKIGMSPLGVAVHGERCYVTDALSMQVIAFDKYSGEEIMRIGSRMTDPNQYNSDEAGQFRLISDLAVDGEGNLYVSDRVVAQVVKFDSSGKYLRSYGHMGETLRGFVRPKGISIDRENRIWVVDAATQLCKIYNQEGLLLLFFGMAGNDRGQMNLPATVIVDYDHVELFSEYAVEGADVEFLVIVTNHFGPHKVAVYGFGKFPEQYSNTLPETIERSGSEEGTDEVKEESVQPKEEQRTK